MPKALTNSCSLIAIGGAGTHLSVQCKMSAIHMTERTPRDDDPCDMLVHQ